MHETIEVTIVRNIELEPGFACSSCEWASTDDDELEKSYECGNCGTQFRHSESMDGESTRCPDCNRFSAVLYEATCPECGEEANAMSVADCPQCGETIKPEDLQDHMQDCM